VSLDAGQIHLPTVYIRNSCVCQWNKQREADKYPQSHTEENFLAVLSAEGKGSAEKAPAK
jgi:hypothetical protein